MPSRVGGGLMRVEAIVSSYDLVSSVVVVLSCGCCSGQYGEMCMRWDVGIYTSYHWLGLGVRYARLTFALGNVSCGNRPQVTKVT